MTVILLLHVLTSPLALFVCVLLATLGMEQPVMVYTHTYQQSHLLYYTYTLTDIDECALEIDSCSDCGTCINTQGSYECDCLPGSTGDTCEGQYTITALLACNIFVIMSFLHTDIDECELGIHNCSENSQCFNRNCTFKCECLPGFTGGGIVCEGQ